MKVLVDMNLSPLWVPVLERNGFSSVHWSAVGEGTAIDPVVLGWARDNGYILFTNDLDFGAILAATRAAGPSVVQVRTQDVSPDHLGDIVVTALREHQEILGRDPYAARQTSGSLDFDCRCR